MQYKNLVGVSLEEAKKYADTVNIKCLFVETKDVKNVYPTKRVVRQKLLQDADGECMEILYTGFPVLKED